MQSRLIEIINVTSEKNCPDIEHDYNPLKFVRDTQKCELHHKVYENGNIQACALLVKDTCQERSKGWKNSIYDKNPTALRHVTTIYHRHAHHVLPSNIAFWFKGFVGISHE